MTKATLPTTNQTDKVDEYRQKIVTRIANSEEIFRLVADDGAVFGEGELLWKHIFPMEFVPETQKSAQTLVCVDLDVNYDEHNGCYEYIDVYIFIATHMNTMRHPNGNGLRVDAITHTVRKLFDRQFIEGLGVKKCQFLYNRRYTPSSTQFRGRALCLRFRDFQYGV